MKKYNKRRSKRIRNLIILCCLSAIVLTVSTYAWFVGMKTVNVSAFDIDIATTEGLTLSMDGENWSYQLDAAGTEAYVNNTNKSVLCDIPTFHTSYDSPKPRKLPHHHSAKQQQQQQQLTP